MNSITNDRVLVYQFSLYPHSELNKRGKNKLIFHHIAAFPINQSETFCVVFSLINSIAAIQRIVSAESYPSGLYCFNCIIGILHSAMDNGRYTGTGSDLRFVPLSQLSEVRIQLKRKQNHLHTVFYFEQGRINPCRLQVLTFSFSHA